MRLKLLEPIRKFFAGDFGQSFLSWTNSGLPKLSRTGLLAEYKGIVFNCIDAITTDYAKYQPLAFKGNPDDPESAKPLSFHPLLAVLQRPNPKQSRYEFFRNHRGYMELAGESFWYMVRAEPTGRVREIYLLRPDRIQIAVNDEGEVRGYTYTHDNGTQQPFSPDEIYHIKNFNPVNSYRGMSPIEAALAYIKTEESSTLFQYNFLKNQASPSGILTFKENITADKFKEIKDKWKEQQVGTVNAGKTLFLRGGDAKFEKIGLTLADFDETSLANLNEDRIYRAYKVPKAILGQTDMSGLGRANIETIIYVFAARTIDPKQSEMDDALTDIARKYYGDKDVFFDHVSQVPEDKEFILRKHEVAAGKWLTRNEIREKDGMAPVPGGDQLYTSFNEVPISGGSSSQEKKITLGKLKKVREVKKEADSQQTYFNALQRLENATNGKYKGETRELLEKQKEGLLERLAPLFEKGYQKRGLKKLYDNEMPDEDEETRYFLEVLIPIILAAMQKSGQTAIEFIGAADIEFILTQAIRDGVFDSTQRLMKSFTRETVEKIQKQLADAVANKESLKEITKRIESVYSEAKGYRAERIANTEAHKAINRATSEAYQQSGVKRVRWSIMGEACEFCRALDGTIISIGQSFVPKGATIDGEDGGSYVNDYDDIKYADAHPNCVVGDTEVLSSLTKEMMRADYSGDMIHITHTTGRLSVTPNHVLLTDRGFMAAKFIRQGDNVVDCSGLQRIISDNPDTDNRPAKISDIFESLSKSSGVTTISVPVSPENLHGDARMVNGKIDIISTNGLLRRDAISTLDNHIQNTLFYSRDLPKPLNGFGDLDTVFFGLLLASYGDVSISDIPSLFSGTSPARREAVRLLLISNYNARISKALGQRGSADSGYFRKLQEAFPSIVKLNKVVKVERKAFDGHVYDLSSLSTLYIANGVLSSNCDCKLIPILDQEASFKPANIKDSFQKHRELILKEKQEILSSILKDLEDGVYSKEVAIEAFGEEYRKDIEAWESKK